MNTKRKTENQKGNISNLWGKLKSEDFNFTLIENFFSKKGHNDTFQIINDRIINDIDLYKLFMYIDRTNSKIGQQYYFNNLLSLDFDRNKIKKRELFINYLLSNREDMVNIQLILSKLDSNDAYYISDLFLSDLLPKPKWLWVISLLSITSLLVVITTFFYNALFFILIPLLIINMIVHFWNKRNIFMYMYSIPQLILLAECANKIIAFDFPFPTKKDKILKSIKSINSLKKQMFVFKIEAGLNSSELYSIIQLISEYIKILFVIEPIIVFNVLDKLKNRKEEIQNLFDFIGEIDTAISIANLRSGAPYYCIPNISMEKEMLEFIDLYHPLIEGCISNSLSIKGKSILLTGSNMSGKTTFIRTLALNSLLAQTINTCFARRFDMHPMKIFTAIHISDDLFANKSYYLEEVLLIKTMIDEANTNGANLYFLDELFKGTNTRERVAAGKAVLSYLVRGRNIVIVSTHDIELTELLLDKYELYHFTEVVENGNINFDYKIKKGKLTTYNAIKILEINNYPEEIIQDAKSIVKNYFNK